MCLFVYRIEDTVIFQPWFLPQRIGFAIHSLVPPFFWNKTRYFFDDYGCMICGTGTGSCYGRIRKKLTSHRLEQITSVTTSLAEAAKNLDANQDFDRDRILSTGAHEAMPGHFLQLSIARRHPDFVRKIQRSSEFEEGWAFYGEELFVQLGLYGDDLDARYYTAQWERVRGARAVVDPELASGTWSVDQAVQFFAHETGFSPEQAKAAISGIALGPGYVISYTAGRAQIEALLSEYRAKAGAGASLLDFHDRLLCYGSTPISVVGPELLADLAKPLAEVRAGAAY